MTTDPPDVIVLISPVGPDYAPSSAEAEIYWESSLGGFFFDTFSVVQEVSFDVFCHWMFNVRSYKETRDYFEAPSTSYSESLQASRIHYDGSGNVVTPATADFPRAMFTMGYQPTDNSPGSYAEFWSDVYNSSFRCDSGLLSYIEAHAAKDRFYMRVSVPWWWFGASIQPSSLRISKSEITLELRSDPPAERTASVSIDNVQTYYPVTP